VAKSSGHRGATRSMLSGGTKEATDPPNPRDVVHGHVAFVAGTRIVLEGGT
jgi:hypothetical protein